MSDRFFLQLVDAVYEVRRVGESRQILVKGKWMRAEDFGEYLADAGEWGQLVELIREGMRIVKGDPRHV